MCNITVFVNLNLKGGPSKNATELSSLAVTTLNGRLGLKITKQFIKSNYYNTAISIKKFVFFEPINEYSVSKKFHFYTSLCAS